MASYNRDKLTLCDHRFKRNGKHQFLTKETLQWKLSTDDEVLMLTLWSRYLSELWSHTTANWTTKKIAAQMLVGQEAICKTSFGWICGHQYYVILAKVLFFSRKTKLCLVFFFSLRFCYLIKIFNPFIGAKHKATETFSHSFLHKPFNKII